ncbi:serine protease, partial [Akkermansiaceae bacterium]|nr:serine protease [Akkermansiaceae bacterium]
QAIYELSMKVQVMFLATWFSIIVQVNAEAERLFDTRKLDLTNFIEEVLSDEAIPKGAEITELLEKGLKVKQLKIKNVESSVDKGIYKYAEERTYQLVKPYNCGKCDKWHNSGATAWALSEDGLMVSNFHCFVKNIEEGMGVTNSDLEMFPVVEILIADQNSDFVIFKVKLPEGRSIKAFPVGQPASRGDDLHLVSHTLGKKYYYSRGYVSGYVRRVNRGVSKAKEALWMQTELGYGFGSSGGAIINDEGEVVGMVSYIDPSFADRNKNNVKEGVATDYYANKIFEHTVPVSAMRKRLVIEGE